MQAPIQSESNIATIGDSAVVNEFVQLIEKEIPECQHSLRDSHLNLERVAEYCDTNYLGATDKSRALEETRNYATQSLAFVAFKVTSLAYNLLHLLHLQAGHLTDLESQVNHISQQVDIYKEKVARREIGLLTTPKRVTRLHKILVPANPERPIKYVRKPIDYSVLDDVGHGVRVADESPQPQLHHSMHTLKLNEMANRTAMVAPQIFKMQDDQRSIYRSYHNALGLDGSSTTRSVTSAQSSLINGGDDGTGTRHKNLSIDPEWAPNFYLEKVVALFDYTRDKSDELTFCENSIIYVTKKNEDGWYEGVLNGETGLFPSNYVEPCL